MCHWKQQKSCPRWQDIGTNPAAESECCFAVVGRGMWADIFRNHVWTEAGSCRQESYQLSLRGTMVINDERGESRKEQGYTKAAQWFDEWMRRPSEQWLQGAVSERTWRVERPRTSMVNKGPGSPDTDHGFVPCSATQGKLPHLLYLPSVPSLNLSLPTPLCFLPPLSFFSSISISSIYQTIF